MDAVENHHHSPLNMRKMTQVSLVADGGMFCLRLLLLKLTNGILRHLENKLILAQWRYIVLLHKSLPEPVRTYCHLDLKEHISVYYKLHIVFLSNKCILKRCAPSPFPFVQSPKFKPNTNAITEESLMDEFRLDGWLSDYGSRHLATIVW